MLHRPALSLLVIILCFASRASHADEPLGAKLIGLRMLDQEGRVHQLGDRDGSRGVALVFLSPECPVSNQYVPELNRLANEMADQPCEFFGVVADPTISRASVDRFCRDFQIKFPVLFDAAG